VLVDEEGLTCPKKNLLGRRGEGGYGGEKTSVVGGMRLLGEREQQGTERGIVNGGGGGGRQKRRGGKGL